MEQNATTPDANATDAASHFYYSADYVTNGSFATNWTYYYDYNGTEFEDVVTTDIESRLWLFLSEPHKILAVILSLAAIFLNVFSLLALSKVQHRMTTHFLFIISLALSDILIGVSVLMYLLNKVINQSYMPGRGPWAARLTSRCMFVFIKSLNCTSLNISLLNLIGMAFDHFIAILKPLHYPAIMTRRRVSMVILSLWLLSFLCGFSDYFTAIQIYPALKFYYNYCEIVWLTPYHDEYVTFSLAIICVTVMMIMYGLIYRKIRARKRPKSASSSDNRSKDRKALGTTLLIVGSFIVCWLPTCLFQLVLIAIVKINPDMLRHMAAHLRSADQFLYDLLLLNCIVDPIIYAVRINEIRLGYRRLCCNRFGLCGDRPGDVSTYSFRMSISHNDSLLTRKPPQQKLQSVSRMDSEQSGGRSSQGRNSQNRNSKDSEQSQSLKQSESRI